MLSNSLQSLLFDWPEPIIVHYDIRAVHGSTIMRGKGGISHSFLCEILCSENVPEGFFLVNFKMYLKSWKYFYIGRVENVPHTWRFPPMYSIMLSSSNGAMSLAQHSSLSYRSPHNMAATIYALIASFRSWEATFWKCSRFHVISEALLNMVAYYVLQSVPRAWSSPCSPSTYILYSCTHSHPNAISIRSCSL